MKGFVEALLLGGAILGIYTALLAYVGCKTGLSMDLLAQHSFGKKGSYLPSALISFTQIGWFGVGVAMFAIPVAKLIAPDKPWVVPLLVALAGICMTGSAFFGIRAMTIVSYISVPLIAMLGITAMIMAVRQGDASLAENLRKARGLASSPAREWLSVPLSAAVRQLRILPDLQRRRKRLSGPLRLPFSWETA